MRNAERKFAISLAGFVIAMLLFGASLQGALGPDDGWPATIAGVGGLMLMLVTGYIAVVSARAGIGAARLRAGSDVIARWRVPAETWRAFRDIRAEQTGVSVPSFRGLLFAPREVGAGEAPEVICGTRSLLIDGCYFAVSPGRGTGMEQAGLVPTRPPCVALIIAMMGGAHGTALTRRWLLLLPVAPDAQDQADAAIRHYAAEVAKVRDIGDLAWSHPLRAAALFWGVLLASIAAAAAGVAMEVNGYSGTLPAALGISGFMVGLGTLIIGLKVFLSRRR